MPQATTKASPPRPTPWTTDTAALVPVRLNAVIAGVASPTSLNASLNVIVSVAPAALTSPDSATGASVSAIDDRLRERCCGDAAGALQRSLFGRRISDRGSLAIGQGGSQRQRDNGAVEHHLARSRAVY